MIAPADSSRLYEIQQLTEQLVDRSVTRDGKKLIARSSVAVVLGISKERAEVLGREHQIQGQRFEDRGPIYWLLEEASRLVPVVLATRPRVPVNYQGLNHLKKRQYAPVYHGGISAEERIYAIVGAVHGIRIAQGCEEDIEFMCRRIEGLAGELLNDLDVPPRGRNDRDNAREVADGTL